MKNIFITIILLSTLFLASISCDFDKYPYNQLENEEAFNSINDLKSFNNGMYSALRGVVYSSARFAQDIQADIFNAGVKFGNNFGPIHRWNDFSTSEGALEYVWKSYYTALANINNFINNVDNVKPNNKNEEIAINNYKGDAYFLRAYYFFQLVKLYAKDYDPATVTTDLGIPLTVTYNPYIKPKRSTLFETYKQILDDITLSKKNLTRSGKLGAELITTDCILALEAQVYLSMQEYSKAIDAVDVLVQSNKYPLINSKQEFKDMWHKDAKYESILQLYASYPKQLPGNDAGSSSYLGYVDGTNVYQPSFIPQQWIIDLYDQNKDIRFNTYLDKKSCDFDDKLKAELLLINKYPGNPELYTSTTNYQHKPKVFRIAEMYLIKAEALFKIEGKQSEALTTLNELREKRGLDKLTGIEDNDLFEEIKKERMREMLCEGTRIYDLKRWNEGFERKAPQDIKVIMQGEYYDQLKIDKANDKFVWGIPANDMITNSNLNGQQNKGW